MIVVPTFYGHDIQRVGQIVIAVISFVLICTSVAKYRWEITGSRFHLFALLILLLGLASSFQAADTQWALAELSLLISCCCITSVCAAARSDRGPSIDRFLMWFVILLCSAKVAQFLASSVAAFVSMSPAINTDVLIEGFSNKRFYGQFQTFTLPILALPLLLQTTKKSAKAWVSALLACWWMIAICGGTRGTWLGMGCAAGIVFCCGPYARRWFCWQLSAAVVGLGLFWCFFDVLPRYLGIEIVNFAGDRLTTSLSARDIIWHQALEMIKERPLLGFGPMHFADIHNLVAAHPHQAILQWACEWGVPSTLLVGWLAVRGLFTTFKLIRRKAASSEPVDLLRICLFASLLGALAQSMVDGVFVMPYSQLWLAIVVGWLMGIHEWSVKPEPSGPILRWSWGATMILAVGFLVYVVIRDFPHLDEREQQYAHDFGGNLQPRFWRQGVIAIKPD
jgi:O-antigen ligase